jgi:hypothetical protein
LLLIAVIELSTAGGVGIRSIDDEVVVIKAAITSTTRIDASNNKEIDDIAWFVMWNWNLIETRFIRDFIAVSVCVILCYNSS